MVFISGDPFISGFPGPIQRCCGDLLRDCLVMMMMMVYLSVPFISEPLSWICGYIFPQMVVIGSEIRAVIQSNK